MDCRGFEVLAQSVWDCWFPWQASPIKPDMVGFLICRAPAGDIYGALGTVSGINQTCATGYGIPLPVDAELAVYPLPLLEQFALACGLSITARAGLELGDGLVIAGMNSLAHYVLAAGRAHGADTLCLTHQADSIKPDTMPDNDRVMALDDAAAFDEQLAAFVAGVTGKVVFADTCGDVALIHAMATHLPRFGRLLLCRPDVDASVVLNMRDFQHRRSAVFDYWAGPVTPEASTALQRHYQQAGRLIQWRHMAVFERDDPQTVTMELERV